MDDGCGFIGMSRCWMSISTWGLVWFGLLACLLGMVSIFAWFIESNTWKVYYSSVWDCSLSKADDAMIDYVIIL